VAVFGQEFLLHLPTELYSTLLYHRKPFGMNSAFSKNSLVHLHNAVTADTSAEVIEATKKAKK